MIIKNQGMSWSDNSLELIKIGITFYILFNALQIQSLHTNSLSIIIPIL